MIYMCGPFIIGQYAQYTSNFKHEIVSLIQACDCEGAHQVLLHHLVPKEVKQNAFKVFNNCILLLHTFGINFVASGPVG